MGNPPKAEGFGRVTDKYRTGEKTRPLLGEFFSFFVMSKACPVTAATSFGRLQVSMVSKRGSEVPKREDRLWRNENRDGAFARHFIGGTGCFPTILALGGWKDRLHDKLKLSAIRRFCRQFDSRLTGVN